MKKLIAMITLLCMLFAAVTAEEADHSVTLSFESNITTGYYWTGFVVAGNSAEIDENASGYVSDYSPEPVCGLGGTHYFKINALQPGDSVIAFTHTRGGDDTIAQLFVLVSVDDDMNIFTCDITEYGVFTGTVTEVNAEERTVTLETAIAGELIATIAEDAALPVNGETIRIYTNGMMTMSLPPIVNALGWETIPDEMARNYVVVD